jgi:DNA-binding NtrC family response regulator
MILERWWKKWHLAAPGSARLRILAVAIPGADRSLLAHMGKEHGWDLCFCPALEEALAALPTGDFTVILCDRDQPGLPWRQVLAHLVAHSPKTSILLVSPVNDDFLWREVVQCGGYDVLARPLRGDSAVQAIHAAARSTSPRLDYSSR